MVRALHVLGSGYIQLLRNYRKKLANIAKYLPLRVRNEIEEDPGFLFGGFLDVGGGGVLSLEVCLLMLGSARPSPEVGGVVSVAVLTHRV